MHYKSTDVTISNTDPCPVPFSLGAVQAGPTGTDCALIPIHFLFFFETRIVLHSGEWLTCGRQRRRPPTRGIKRFTRWPSHYYHFIIYYANYERSAFKNETKVLRGPFLYRTKALQTCGVLHFFERINLERHINQVVGWTGSPALQRYADSRLKRFKK